MADAIADASATLRRSFEEAVEEHLSRTPKNSPVITAEDIEKQRRKMLDQIEILLDLHKPQQRARQGQHWEAVARGHERIIEVYRLQLDELRSRFDAQEREKQRAADRELTIRQAAAAHVQADAALEQVQIARSAKQAAWFAGLAAFAAVVIPLLQWLVK
jgi:hypothetical protein